MPPLTSPAPAAPSATADPKSTPGPKSHTAAEILESHMQQKEADKISDALYAQQERAAAYRIYVEILLNPSRPRAKEDLLAIMDDLKISPEQVREDSGIVASLPRQRAQIAEGKAVAATQPENALLEEGG